MRVHDITLSISEGTPLYPGDPPITITRVTDVARGDAFTLSAVTMSSHSGTHVDAPLHFYPGGLSVDQLPPDVLVGPAVVVSMEHLASVTASNLEHAAIPQGTERLLIKSMPSPGHLAEDAARWLIGRGMKLVGIDQLSVDAPGSRSFVAHRALLGAGVVIVEGLDLRRISPGLYTLACLPVKLAGCDGAPARVMLMEGV